MFSAAADGWDDGDFAVGGEERGEAAGIANVFVADEDVDVLADLALLGDDAVANAGVERVKGRQRIGQDFGRLLHLDTAAASGKFTQRAWDVKDHWHD